MTEYAGVTGRQEYDAVFSDRSSAALAILKDGCFVYLSQEAVLSGRVDVEGLRSR
jgi:hypothetical protein